jgi:hypothetical protein
MNRMFHREIYDLRPWYHSFERLGLQTDFGDMRRGLLSRLRLMLRRGEWLSPKRLLQAQPSPHLINQRHKEDVLIPFLSRYLRELGQAPACLELFCADGYYACLIKNLRPDARVTGVDRNPNDIRRARAAAHVLGFSGIDFVIDDVWDYLRNAPPFDLIMCAGGLYHLADPRRLIELLRPAVKRYLIVQSVVTLETESSDYFVTPAPGWRHGSRFSHAALKRWLLDAGWMIVEQTRNELTGNERCCDRGSSYFVCRPAI